MNKQIDFPTDWSYGYMMSAEDAKTFTPDAGTGTPAVLEDDLLPYIRVANNDQVRTLGGGWSKVEENGRFYLYNRADAAACNRCASRRGDVLYLFKGVAVYAVEWL